MQTFNSFQEVWVANGGSPLTGAVSAFNTPSAPDNVGVIIEPASEPMEENVKIEVEIEIPKAIL